MKDILRIALGVVFTFFFLLFLLLSAIRFEFLRTDFWTEAIGKSGFYQQLTGQIEDWQERVNKQARGGQKLAIAGIVTEERARDVVETNVERLVDYLNGKTNKLLVYLPVNDWKISREVTSRLPWKVSGWTKETEVKVLAMSLGMKAEAVDQLETGLGQVQMWVARLGGVWLGLLVVCLALLAIHFSLGRGRGKATGSLWLLAVSGLIAGVIGFGGTTVGRLLAQGRSDFPAWLQGLIAELIGGFFRLGGSIGGGIVLVSAVALVVVMKMKGLPEKEKEGVVKRLMKFVTGAILGVIILILLIALPVVLLGGGFNFSVGGK